MSSTGSEIFVTDRMPVLAVCGGGTVEFLRQLDADHYEVKQRVVTAPGARTGLLARSRGSRAAGLRERLAAAIDPNLFPVRP